MPFSLLELREIIDTARFDRLIGELECQCLDVKSQPYQFSKGMDAKRELTKDVAAFANAAGGCILIGFSTKLSPVRDGEEITEVRPLPRASFDPDQYRKILAEWLYPLPKGITASFVPFGSDLDRGIGVVFVPLQDSATKPFLITRTIGDSKSTEVVIGYVERRIDATDVRSVVELHQALRIGTNLERELLGRIQNLELLINEHFSATSVNQVATERETSLRTRMKRILAHPSLAGNPVLLAYAEPLENGELRSIFSDRSDSIRRQLENPPSVRSRGWGLATGAAARFIEGKHLRVESFREVIDLYRDGCLVLGGAIDSDFLTWADPQNTRLHPLALIELLTNFAKFFRLVIDDLRATPNRLTLGLELNFLHLNDKKVRLPAGPLGTLRTISGAPEAPGESWKCRIVVDAAQYDPARIAFELARELYVWFGLSDEDIPYTTGTGDDQKIDLDQIFGLS